jgi:hypothetical protein
VIDAIHACEQLAMYYERRAKDLDRAVEFICLALAKVKRLRTASRSLYAAPKLARIEAKLLNRAARLQHRIGSKRERAVGLPLLQQEVALPSGRLASERVLVAKASR